MNILFYFQNSDFKSPNYLISKLSYFQIKDVVVKIENLGLESIVNGKVNPIFNLITTVISEINSLER